MRKAALLLLMLLGSFVSADERILRYHSDILVRQDGWIEVTETISVRAEGQQIRRGVYRDYPVRYRDRFGNNVKVLYEPQSVARNGEPEAYHTETSGDDVRTYFGSADRLLPPGEYTYTYRYNAGRMLGFYDESDELYWNVTGNEWNFPIDAASATVSFESPIPAESLSLSAYTGRGGATGSDYTARTDDTGRARFNVTRPLQQREGLTIVVEWPKGYVAEPTDLQKAIWLLSDNLNFVIALLGLGAILAYYIPVWRSHGKDPAPGVIFTRYEPPANFSPASLRYIRNMGYDDTVMSAAIVSLAVKGYLRIEKDGKRHTLHMLDPGENPPALTTGEQQMFQRLFMKSDSLTLINTNHERIGGARKAHEMALKHDYHKRYFVTNGILNLPALLIGLIVSVVAIAIGPSVLVIVTIAIMVVLIVFFAIVLKRPTGLGRKLLDEISGFQEYLEIAEKDELNLRNPPQKTPVLFEQLLPFALALGVEQQWAEKFTKIFAELKGQKGSDWQPAWYSGSWNSMNLRSNTSSLSSGLGSAISSSVSPPGSSSGGGGGGSSGGGGGGGGGGGW